MVVGVELKHEVSQSFSLNEFHDHCEVLVIFYAVVYSYNVGVVAGSQDFAFLPDHKEVLAREQCLVYVLYCHFHLLKLLDHVCVSVS